MLRYNSDNDFVPFGPSIIINCSSPILYVIIINGKSDSTGKMIG